MAKAIVFTVLGVFAVLGFNNVMETSNYRPSDYIFSQEIRPAITALADGRSQRVRELCAGPYEHRPYAGIPGALIAASYYRDFMKGDEGALDRMEPYIREAHKKEQIFLTRYYLALHLYENHRYEQAKEELHKASQSMIGVTGWSRMAGRSDWQRAIGLLIKAATAAQEGKGHAKTWCKAMDRRPEGRAVEVWFRI